MSTRSLSATTRAFYRQGVSGVHVLDELDGEVLDAGIAAARSDGIGPGSLTDLYLLWTLPQATRAGERLLDGRDHRIAELLAASAYGALLDHPIGPLKTHGSPIDRYVLQAKELGLDHKQVAVCIGALHYILNAGDFSTQEVTRVLQDIVDTGPSKWLRLASMKLREVPPGLLDVKGVEQLDLSRNPFKELPARFFELVELRELRLEKAKIRSLDGIGQLTKLEYLNLNESKLKEVPPSIGQLENLRDLRLVETGVEDLPDGIATLQRLERLMITLTPLSRNRARVAELRSMGLPL